MGLYYLKISKLYIKDNGKMIFMKVKDVYLIFKHKILLMNMIILVLIKLCSFIGKYIKEIL